MTSACGIGANLYIFCRQGYDFASLADGALSGLRQAGYVEVEPFLDSSFPTHTPSARTP